MLGIKGNVSVGIFYAVPLTTFDDSNDMTAPSMTLGPSRDGNVALGGPSTGSIVFQFNIPNHIAVRHPRRRHAQWSINDSQPNTQLFANTGSQVSVTRGKTRADSRP